MKPTSKILISRKIIIFLLITAVVIFGLFFFVFLPTVGAVQKSYTNFLAQKKSAEILLNSGATYSVIQSQAGGLKQSIAHFQNSFLSPGLEIDFIKFLEKTGSENGIQQTIQLNDPSLLKSDDFYPSALLVIKIKGKFLQFLHYLIDLEHSQYYINISSININSSSPNSLREQQTPIQSPFTILNISEEGALDVASNEGEYVKQSETEINATITAHVFWNYE